MAFNIKDDIKEILGPTTIADKKLGHFGNIFKLTRKPNVRTLKSTVS